jgi:hypothetical protein
VIVHFSIDVPFRQLGTRGKLVVALIAIVLIAYTLGIYLPVLAVESDWNRDELAVLDYLRDSDRGPLSGFARDISADDLSWAGLFTGPSLCFKHGSSTTCLG